MKNTSITLTLFNFVEIAHTRQTSIEIDSSLTYL